MHVSVLQYARENNLEISWNAPQETETLVEMVHAIQQREQGPTRLGEWCWYLNKREKKNKKTQLNIACHKSPVYVSAVVAMFCSRTHFFLVHLYIYYMYISW